MRIINNLAFSKTFNNNFFCYFNIYPFLMRRIMLKTFCFILHYILMRI